MRPFVVQRPDQDVQLLRLELPEEVEEVERRHALSSWRPGIARCPRARPRRVILNARHSENGLPDIPEG